MGIGWAVIKALAIYEGITQAREISERFNFYRWAREYCDEVGKPLLRIGMKRSPFEPPNGDYTLDIDPRVEDLTDTIGVLGDERFMPFEDKKFGVSFNEHTLEHLHSVEDVELAVNECRRVADYAVLLAPSPYSIYANFFCPSHRLRLWFNGNKILVRENDLRTGLGPAYQGDTGGEPLNSIGQFMVLKYEELTPPVILG
jgi:hypothetical protein